MVFESHSKRPPRVSCFIFVSTILLVVSPVVVWFTSYHTTMATLFNIATTDHSTKLTKGTSTLTLELQNQNGELVNVVPLFAALDRDSHPDSWGAPRMFEAFHFQNEIELLEVRIGELFDIVEKFVVVEMLPIHSPPDSTTNLSFHNMRHRLPQHFLSKVVHFRCRALPTRTLKGNSQLPPNRSDAPQECIKHAVLAAGARRFDLIHFNDANAIMKASTAYLILNGTRAIMQEEARGPGTQMLHRVFPMGIHWQQFAYNFLVASAASSLFVAPWTTEVHLVIDARSVRRMKRHPTALRSEVPDGGWRCRWCFPTVRMFQDLFHVSTAPSSLTHDEPPADHVWKGTCNGAPLFEPATTATIHYAKIPYEVGITRVPQYLREHAQNPRLQYLVPDENACRIPLA